MPSDTSRTSGSGRHSDTSRIARPAVPFVLPTVSAPDLLGHRWTGAYANGSFSLATWNAFDTLCQDVPTVHHIFSDWTFGWVDSWTTDIVSLNAIPLITWQPKPNNCAQIANGDLDAYITTYATALKAWAIAHGTFVLLRPFHEMNLPDTISFATYGFGPGGSGVNTTTNFVAAWRRVHDLFAAAGVTTAHAQFVFCPNQWKNTEPNIVDYYPGDAYVDWLAWDVYNFGLGTGFVSNPTSTWQSVNGATNTTYTQLAALNATKPMMIPEIGCAEAGGNKGTWITQTYLTDIPTLFPRVLGVCWFHQNSSRPWNIDSSSGALTAYRAALQDATWHRTTVPPFGGPSSLDFSTADNSLYVALISAFWW